MSNIHGSGVRITRQDLVDPDRLVPHVVRLAYSGAIDLRDNVQRKDVIGWYATFEPIDRTRRISLPPGPPLPAGED
jgi:hypothetical protein